MQVRPSHLTARPPRRMPPRMNAKQLLSELESLFKKADLYDAMMAAAGKSNGKSSSNGHTTAKRVQLAGKTTNGRRANADQVLSALKGKKLSVGEVAKTVGASKVSVAYHLQKLRDERKVRMRGTRRTARWELVG